VGLCFDFNRNTNSQSGTRTFFHWNYALLDFIFYVFYFDFGFIFVGHTFFTRNSDSFIRRACVSVGLFLILECISFSYAKCANCHKFYGPNRNKKKESKEHVLGGEIQIKDGPWNFVFSIFFFYLNIYYFCFERSTTNFCMPTVSKLYVAELTWSKEQLEVDFIGQRSLTKQPQIGSLRFYYHWPRNLRVYIKRYKSIYL